MARPIGGRRYGHLPEIPQFDSKKIGHRFPRYPLHLAARLEWQADQPRALALELLPQRTISDINTGQSHKAVQTDADPFVYVSPYVVPGRYKVAYYTSGFKAADIGELSVKARRETLVDITPPDSLKKPPPPPPTYPLRVIVTRDGKPAAGVIVKSQLSQEQFSQQQVTTYTGDTTDMAGQAEFLATAGTNWQFAAMDHDLSFGWQTIEVEAKPNEVKIELGSVAADEDKEQATHARAMFGLPVD